MAKYTVTADGHDHVIFNDRGKVVKVVKYAKGDTIDLPEDEAERLIGIGLVPLGDGDSEADKSVSTKKS